jgi:hypothetical protein
MHGHSPGFFSGFTFNVVSLPPERVRALSVKHGTTPPPPRDVKDILAKAARRFIPEEGLTGEGWVIGCDARRLDIPTGGVDLVITSPPFFDTIDYEDANWLRRWFLHDEGESKIADNAISHPNHIGRSLPTCCESWRGGESGRIVFEVGPVKGRCYRCLGTVLEASAGWARFGTLTQ